MCSSAEATGQDGLAFDQKKPLPQSMHEQGTSRKWERLELWNRQVYQTPHTRKKLHVYIQTGRVQNISPPAGPVSLATHVRPPEHGGAKPQLHGQRLRGHWLA